MEINLQGKVAVVAGASRGAGKGIALALGAGGAKVYVTARSTRHGTRTEQRTETIEDTAEEITRRGGRGIPIACDYKDDRQVEAVFTKVRAENTRLDLLVNAVWGGNEGFDGFNWNDGTNFPHFWKQSMQRWDETFTAGVRAYLFSSMAATRIMLAHQGGLIVNITDSIGARYRGNIFWDLAHAAINRLTYAVSLELQDYQISCVAITPGWMRTERVLESIKAEELFKTESCEYVGRVICALLSDPHHGKKSGQEYTVYQLAQEYQVYDIDGTQPAFWETHLTQ